MLRASYNNQARVHNGYHYPRSILTALRSRISYPRFISEFPDCVDRGFKKYYLIGRQQSNVTAKQFMSFCGRIGAPCKEENGPVSELVNKQLIEAVFAVEEVAFDAASLRNEMRRRLLEVGVECKFWTSAARVQRRSQGLEVRIQSGGDEHLRCFDQVFNCTYSGLNQFSNSGSENIPLKHEIAELCLVDVPALRNTGVTVMCGPFFSIMPFPPESCSSFSHVRYTPRYSWSDHNSPKLSDSSLLDRFRAESVWNRMRMDAQRYIPAISDSTYRRSLMEVKTVLPSSELDDSRPILFRPNWGMQGFHSVLGGKIDNIYDIISAVEAAGLDK